MEKKDIYIIQAMMKLIPNGFGVTLEDLEEIYSQDDRRK